MKYNRITNAEDNFRPPVFWQTPCWTNTFGEGPPHSKISELVCSSLKNKLWKKNEYSKVTLSQAAQDSLQQLHNTLVAKQYAKRTIRNYMQEMRFLFAHYPDVVPTSISQQDIINYINFIINEHGVGREKCHQVAQSCSFFYKHVYPSAFITATAIGHW